MKWDDNGFLMGASVSFLFPEMTAVLFKES